MITCDPYNSVISKKSLLYAELNKQCDLVQVALNHCQYIVSAHHPVRDNQIHHFLSALCVDECLSSHVCLECSKAKWSC